MPEYLNEKDEFAYPSQEELDHLLKAAGSNEDALAAHGAYVSALDVLAQAEKDGHLANEIRTHVREARRKLASLINLNPNVWVSGGGEQ